jgi:hypothetical protein
VGAHLDRTCAGIGDQVVGNADEGVGPLVAGPSEVVSEVREVEADVFAAAAEPGDGRRRLSKVRSPRRKLLMGNQWCWLR